MAILFRHDDLAQIIILTANFIERDWSMSQGLWLSPLLPLSKLTASPGRNDVDSTSCNYVSSDIAGKDELEDEKSPPFGSGSRFKTDILAYVRAYGPSRTAPLVKSLSEYDFSAIKAALVASVPGKQNLRASDPGRETLWGWPGLKKVLRSIKQCARDQQHQDTKSGTPSDPEAQAAAEEGKCKAQDEKDRETRKPHIVMQVSSVASIGEKWMQQTFLPALAALPFLSIATPSQKPRTSFSLIFPTASTIQQSVNGYTSGASIHMKLSSPAQQKQLQYLRPMLCHWSPPKSNPPSQFFTARPQVMGRAMRRRAAPHIKTYIRFSSSKLDKIEWALLTSANLSTQAWGAADGAGGEVRICSYEIGVAVWPALWCGRETEAAEMMPVFGRDMPQGQKSSVGLDDGEMTAIDEGSRGRADGEQEQMTVVGLRMPYDLPLTSYTAGDTPWCAEAKCDGLDCKGKPWPGSRKK